MTSATEPNHDHLSRRLYTAVISDVLDSLGVPEQVLNAQIRAVVSVQQPLIGRAATARAIPVDTAPEHPYAKMLEAVDLLRGGDVWVIAGEPQSAIFGALLATAAKARGARGCIVDGAVRDTRELEGLEFPTFATHASPVDSMGRDEIVEHGCPIECAGVKIQPGDLMVADKDGVVAVPADLAQEVLERALAKVRDEHSMRTELAEGVSAASAFTKYGIL
jgi:4-hydroxy-4-methyl-2-oxoglutarate aldolase